MPSSVACVPPDVETRRLGLLDDIVPNLSTVAVFAYAPNLPSPNALQASQNDGSKLGLHVTPVLINSLPDGLPDAFEAARAAHAQAVMLYPDDAFAVNISRIAVGDGQSLACALVSPSGRQGRAFAVIGTWCG